MHIACMQRTQFVLYWKCYGKNNCQNCCRINHESTKQQPGLVVGLACPSFAWRLKFTRASERHTMLPEALRFKTSLLKRAIYKWMAVLAIWALRGSGLFRNQSQHGDAFSARQQPLTSLEYKSAGAGECSQPSENLGPCRRKVLENIPLASGAPSCNNAVNLKSEKVYLLANLYP